MITPMNTRRPGYATLTGARRDRKKRREIEMIIERPEQISVAQHWVGKMASRGLPAGPVAVRLGRERRTLDQNAHIHPVVRAIQRHMGAAAGCVGVGSREE